MFWNVLLWMFEAFVLIASLMIVVMVIIDLFRDSSLAGGWKALWILFLVFVPFFTVLVYTIARGKGMSNRMMGGHHAPYGGGPHRLGPSMSPGADLQHAREQLDEDHAASAASPKQ